eukprot:Protomagalhaensia_wolfi_Nauph_80__3432@NODE_3485_length_785_cov_108_950402_g2736_i0_p1_GENE_NODE_3485_length_785_cov_108_950402_g2736_i0NODE_3485_length_785_cov_108_950402_g2736_i0_p1_ORF_typecomplete_len171_score4_26NUDIX/PF00293_28/4_3e21_NODE_3485_length_785_cov_108_950402_g2736_i0271729
MKDQQKAAGLLPICVRGDQSPTILVLQASNHLQWSPPKGYVDKDESLMAAAIREFEEETGSKASDVIQFVPHTEYSTSYKAWGGDKVVHWFVVFCTEEFNVRLSSEHRGYKWVSLADYRKLQPQYQNLHDICQRAVDDVRHYIATTVAPLFV